MVAVCVLVAGLQAAEKNEVTLKGAIMCAKCELKEGKKCQTVITVKEKGKDVTYYFKDKGNKERTVKLGVLRNKAEMSLSVELPAPQGMKTKRLISRRTNI